MRFGSPPDDIAGIRAAAHHLVTHYRADRPLEHGVAPERMSEINTRYVAAMFERARNNEKSAPRKHHVIPASYLARWERDGRIRVTETDSKRTYTPSPELRRQPGRRTSIRLRPKTWTVTRSRPC